MFKRMLPPLAAALLLVICANAQTKLLRFPDVYGDRVVFTYGGDLWTTSTSGGTATRLTAHPGVETYAKYSPDGKWIAFTGQYDGDEQVYVIPSSGGEPKQLTFYPSKGPLAPRWGFDNQVLGWTKDGKIFFRSERDTWTLPIARLYTVSPQGGSAEVLPMPEAGSGDFSSDGAKMVYSPRFRDFRPEKRYGGGQANKLFIYDLATNDVKLISDGPRASRDAMWIGGTIYYNSDRDGKFNLYAYDTSSAKTAQITKNRDWDIRWPSSDNKDRIIYERDGELEIMDVGSKKTTKLSIIVPDDGVNKRKRQASVGNMITNYGLSPKGERALFAARGDIFSAPIEKGGVRNLTRSSDANDRFPAWSPDGKTVAYISDKSGEEEIWTVPQDGSGQPAQLTTGGKGRRYGTTWSPDGKKIAFSDKDGKVYVLTVATKQVQIITDAVNGQIRDFDWSPKGNFIAYSMQSPNGFSAIYIWSAADNKNTRVTPEMFGSRSPAFDPSGNYLYFLSDCEYAPLISGAEFNYATNRSTQIYSLALQTNGKNPFPYENDEVAITEEKKDTPPSPSASATPDGTPKPKPETPEVINFEGIEKRVVKVPLPADNYGGLSVNKGNLIYSVQPPFYYGRQSEIQGSLRIYSLKDRKETTLLQPGGGYAISADGMKILAGGQGGFSLLDANPTGDKTKK